MQKMSKNKMIDGEENKTAPVEVGEDYFFPDYGVTVRAASREEAEEKAKELANENK
ncbi:hypothetical protein HZB93_03005 [Candidatus Falkowbacteria bacterium]|nr:hypothetical protein [Candidatus Falkowbacteria bacterium]